MAPDQTSAAPAAAAPSGFDGLGLSANLLGVLAHAGFTIPTPIQKQAIPVALEGGDIVGIAQTGTGKTLAFSLPMLQRISATKGRGLIILPTRELALQVEEELNKIGRKFGLRVAVLIGGASMDRQLRQVRQDPHVIVCTPGRLIDHLDQRTLKLDKVNVLVLDEADRMLDMGFAPQINKILQTVPEQRQTMMFSATMPEEITRIANKYMKKPVRIEVARAGTTATNVTQEIYVVEKRDKQRLLKHLLDEEKGTVLVFCRTKHGTKKLTRDIIHMGHNAAEIHGNRTLAQRKLALGGFKTGKYRILVATDIAARGIDVTGIALVLNFDLPEVADDYVHRIGRTGRAERSGKAISFAQPDQGHMVSDIERLTRKQLSITKLPSQLPHFVPAARSASDYARDERDERSGRGGSRGGFGGRSSGGSRGGFGGRRDDRGGSSRGGFPPPRRDDRSAPRSSSSAPTPTKSGERPGIGEPGYGSRTSHPSSSSPSRSHGRPESRGGKGGHGGKSSRPPRVKRPKQGGKLEDYHFGSFKVKE
jgi:ATP-dependent RNA helicase RhlE